MFGIGLIIILVIWGLISLGLGRLLMRLLLRSKASTPSKSTWLALLSLGFSAIIFVLPIADELIAYPRLKQMCEGAGNFQFAPGVNEKNAIGREVYVVNSEKYIMLFPDFHELSMDERIKRSNESARNGVIIWETISNYFETANNQIIFSIKTIKPISSLFAIPTPSGDRLPWILHECGFFGKTNGINNPDFYKSLHLKQVEVPVNRNILKD